MLLNSSVATQPRGSIAEPVAQIIFGVLRVIGMASPQVEIGHQTVEPLLRPFPLKALCSAHPCADAAIAIGEFLKVDAFLERNELTLGQAAADVLQFQSC